MGLRFIATADWHLGMHANYLNEDARSRFQHARYEVLEKIGGLAAERSAQFVVVAGDVFESNQVSPDVVTQAVQALRELPVPVYLMPGNHDALDAASVYDRADFKASQPENVQVLRDSQPVNVAEGAQLVAVPSFTRHPTENHLEQLWADLEVAPSDQIRIVVAHGAVSTLVPVGTGLDGPDPSVIDADLAAAAVREGEADFVVLGDRHSTTEVAPGVWYPGSPEVTARRDTAAGNVLLIEIDKDEDAAGPGGHAAAGATSAATSTVETIPVGQWSYRVEEAELYEGPAVTRLLERLEALRRKNRTAVWLKLSGALTAEEKATLDAGLERLRPAFALLQIWARHYDLDIAVGEGDFADLELAGPGAATIDELLERAADDDEHAMGALSLLSRLVREGSQ